MEKGVTLNLDTATRVDFDNLYMGRPWPVIEMELFEDDGVTPLDLEGDWTFILSRDLNLTDIVLDISLGSQLEAVGNKLIISIEGNAPAPGKYYYGTGRDFLEYYGTVKVNHKIGKWQS
jgi:hypothetical protein